MCAKFHRGSRSRGRAPLRGFTLTELMVVVAMVGILSAIGIASFRRYVNSSKTSEAVAVIAAIRAAQEAYRSENQRYLNVSTSNGDWYPSKSFGATVHAWELKTGQHTDLVRWQTLGARVTQPVQFGYLVNAGLAGGTPTTLQLADNPSLGTPNDAWYVIQARADYDADGKFCNAVATSWTPEIYFENEGE